MSMVDFVLKQMNIFNSIICEDRFELENHITLKTKIENYANFLKQPLELLMFVPCKLVDGVWVVFEKPKPCDCMGYIEDCGGCEFTNIEYQEAKSRCLFEEFEIKERKSYGMSFKYIQNGSFIMYCFNRTTNRFEENIKLKNIEDLVKYELELTPTALKQIGL